MFNWLFNSFGCYENTQDKPRSYSRAVGLIFTFMIMIWFSKLTLSTNAFPDIPDNTLYFMVIMCVGPYGINAVIKILTLTKELIGARRQVQP